MWDIDVNPPFSTTYSTLLCKVCEFVFIPSGVSKEFWSLELGNLNYSGPVELTQYFVKNTTFIQRRQIEAVVQVNNKCFEEQ